MDAHPAADLFPMLDATRLEELAEDIKARGLLVPITTYEGRILDGRNRQRGCELAGVEPRYVEWDGRGDSPTLYVLSLNKQRRDLSESQRAMIAVDSLALLEAEARERKAEGARAHGRGRPKAAEKDGATGHHPIEERAPRSVDRAAKATGTSGRQVARAKRVKQADPALAARVKAGERTLASAEHEVRAREKQEQAGRRVEAAPIVGARLVVGDATRLPLRDGSVDVVLTSPPYGLDKPYAGQADLAVGWEAFMRDWLAEAHRVTRAPGRLILNVPLDTARGGFRPTWPEACGAAIAAGWAYRAALLWDKMNSTKGNRGLGSEASADAPHPVAEVEVVGLFSKGDWKLDGDRPSDIRPEDWQAWGNGLWQLAGESRGWEGHPAPFPEELVRRLLLYLTRVGDVVLDPFSGSGTTALVARRLKRVPIGIERSREYVTSSLRRLARDDERRGDASVAAEQPRADVLASAAG